MTTTVTITGTGVPFPHPDRAGAGVLVVHEDIHLQFDAGRSTLTRLHQLGTGAHELSALFLTHLHSDHVVDVADLVLTRWVQGHLFNSGPLPILGCGDRVRTFVHGLMAAYDYDIGVRVEHVQKQGPELDVRTFDPGQGVQEVWASADRRVVVESVRVHHEPVDGAVGYRVTTPDGSVVISGDTRVCDDVGELAQGAAVLVHEACRASALADDIRGTVFEQIFSYHADTVALGEQAERFAVQRLALTHLIPAPDSPEAEAAFVADVRRGGYRGPVEVCRDLATFVIDNGTSARVDAHHH